MVPLPGIQNSPRAPLPPDQFNGIDWTGLIMLVGLRLVYRYFFVNFLFDAV